MDTDPRPCDRCGEGHYRHRPTPNWPGRFVCDTCGSITVRQDHHPNSAQSDLWEGFCILEDVRRRAEEAERSRRLREGLIFPGIEDFA